MIFNRLAGIPDVTLLVLPMVHLLKSTLTMCRAGVIRLSMNVTSVVLIRNTIELIV